MLKKFLFVFFGASVSISLLVLTLLGNFSYKKCFICILGAEVQFILFRQGLEEILYSVWSCTLGKGFKGKSPNLAQVCLLSVSDINKAPLEHKDLRAPLLSVLLSLHLIFFIKQNQVTLDVSSDIRQLF